MTVFPDPAHPLDAVMTNDDARQRFLIEDDSAAQWAMRKLRAARTKQREYQKIADDEMDRIRLWLSEVTGPLDRDAEFFTNLLSDYARRCRESDTDGRKSISLPAGRVTTRTAGPKWNVDAETFLAWATETNRLDLIRVKQEPNLLAIKESLIQAAEDMTSAAVTADGEVVPGVTVNPATVSVTVSPDYN